MRIEPNPPFAVHPEPDGTTHAIRDDIQITVLPDVEHSVKHRVGTNPAKDARSRWCVIELDGGVKLFVNGTHVVVTTRDLMPTFS